MRQIRRYGGETPPYLRIRVIHRKLVNIANQYAEIREKLANNANSIRRSSRKTSEFLRIRVIHLKLVNNANTNATCVSF